MTAFLGLLAVARYQNRDTPQGRIPAEADFQAPSSPSR
jgi:hypothetical protein